MKQIIVQKYGGSSVATPEKIKAIAKQVAALKQEGHQLIVVVSAMGKTTDELIRLAHQVSDKPNRRELDMLLTTGERVSMALMSMALTDLGCQSISFTGSQAGVLTDNSHSNARIIDIRPFRIEEELKNEKVVVLAGFQGVDPIKKEVTTLGRGGSDTTAVAMAAHFKARCEILKDVDGVCTGDPAIISQAKTFKHLNYSTVGEMCFWGAKVLHYRSVELAQQTKVPLFVGRANNRNIGTLISSEVNMFEKEAVLGVNAHKEVRHLEVQSKSLDEGLKKLDTHLSKNHLPCPQILASVFEKDTTRIMLTAPDENLMALFSSLKKSTELRELGSHVACLSLTCNGSVNSNLIQEVTAVLASESIPVEKILSSSMTLSLCIQPQHLERASQRLHQLVRID